MNTPTKPELNSQDIRTVGIILLVGVAAVIMCLMWAQMTMSQEKPASSVSTFWAGTNKLDAPPQVRAKATGITLHICKSATVYLTTQGGHILAPMWHDKAMEIPGVNPVVCDYKGHVTFYVLPSQDYEIEVVKPETK